MMVRKRKKHKDLYMGKP